MEFTPGPWTFDDTWYLIKGPCGGEIAAIHAGDQENQRFYRQTVYANARLISIAPEMYDSLKFLVDAAETEPGMEIYRAHIERAKEIMARS